MGGRGVFDFGEEVGAANTVKILGNFLIFSAVYSLREALTLAEKNGVDPKAVVDMLTHSLFPSPIYQSYGTMIAEKTASFSQMEIPLKDVGLFKNIAQRLDLPIPVASLVSDLLKSDEEGE